MEFFFPASLKVLLSSRIPSSFFLSYLKMIDKTYFCYWIVSGRSSYIGATVNPTKRLKQHNRINAGGAKRTHGKLWSFQCVISGFRTWREALQFEWAAKYYSKQCRGIESRRASMEALMRKERWTSNSPLSSEVPLIVEWLPTQYGYPPDSLPTCTSTKRKPGNTKFKKLHGVSY